MKRIFLLISCSLFMALCYSSFNLLATPTVIITPTYTPTYLSILTSTPLPPTDTPKPTITNIILPVGFPDPNNPPSDNERTMFRKTGQVWIKKDGYWKLGESQFPSGTAINSQSLGKWVVVGIVASRKGNIVTVTFAQNCRSDYGTLDQPNGSGLICGSGEFTVSEVVLLRALWDEDTYPTNPRLKSGLKADSLEAGDYISIIADADVVRNLSGSVKVYGTQ